MEKTYQSITTLLHSDLKIRIWMSQPPDFDDDHARMEAKKIVFASLQYGKGAKNNTQIANQLMDASPFFTRVEVTDYIGNGTIINRK